jgi:hypothetical protein
VLSMISQLLMRSLNVICARLASISDKFLNPGESAQSVGVLIKIILNAGMRDNNISPRDPLIEYSSSRDITAIGIDCKTLSEENICIINYL